MIRLFSFFPRSIYKIGYIFGIKPGFIKSNFVKTSFSKSSFSRSGFTMIELMVVVSIIAFLSVIAVPNFFKFLAKAKRSEAYMNLGSIYTAQKAYWAENGTYTENLSGPSSAGWAPQGYSGGGKNEKFIYTYGFANGSEGQNYFTGNKEASSAFLNMTKADKTTFVAAAACDIDGDGQPDIITIDQDGNIKIVQDDLA